MSTQADIEPSIPAQFEQQVAQYATRVAVQTATVTQTYDALNRAANRLAHALLSQVGQGCTPTHQPSGDRPYKGTIALLFDQGLDVITAFLGGLKAGLTVVPLDPTYPTARTAYMLADAQAELIVTDTTYTALAHDLVQGDCSVLNLDTIAADLSDANPDVPIAAKTFAYILYTSGSTGTPKGVIENHRNVLHFSRVFARTFPISPDDRLTLLTSCSFSASMADIFGALLNGAALHLYDVKRRGVGGVADWLQREGITIYHSVPTVYRHVMRTLSGHEAFPKLKLIYLAGEPIRARDVALYRTHFPLPCRFLSALGSTEMKIFQQFFIDHDTPLPGEIVPVGYSVDDTDIVLLDDDGQPVKGDGAGEIAVKSPYMCPGYWGQPGLTDAIFIPDPDHPGGRMYRTGDLGRKLPDGCLIHLGRKDAQVKVRGHRVELTEVEAALLNNGDIDEAAVTVREDRLGNTSLVAYIVAIAKPAPTATALQRRLLEKLPDYMVPSIFIALDAMPITPTGKVDRLSLPAPTATRPALDLDYATPRTRVETTLSELWAEVLELDRVGVNDPFLELGGHSLSAVQLIARVLDTFGVEIPLAAMLEAPTVSEMARLVEARQTGQPSLDSDRVGDLQATAAKRLEKATPLSFAQQRLWFLDQLGTPPALYVVARAFTLHGPLNVTALQQSLDAIVERHEILRTTFATLDDEPAQIIGPARPVEIPVTDLSNVSLSAQQAAWQQGMTTAMQCPFDLRRDLLLRAQLFKLKADEHILLLLLHHIACDGWSMRVLFRELGSFYQVFLHATPLDLAPLPIQYADFAGWQRQWFQGQRFDVPLAYWRRQLHEAPAVIDLPSDRQRPAVQTYQGTVRSAALPLSLTQALSALSQREGVTLFVTLCALLQCLLYRYTGQEDVVIGSTVAGRSRVATETLIGLFTNTIVLRTQLSGDPSYRDLLQRTRRVVLDALVHQDLPFEQLIDALQPQRDLSHSPLFQVLFTYQNMPPSPLALSGLAATPIEVDTGTARYDLTFTLWDETDGSLGGELAFNRDLFDPVTIDRLLGHWQTLLSGIVADPEQRLSRLPLMTPIERQQLLGLQPTSEVHVSDDLCVHHLIERQAARTPDVVAVVDEEGSFTYRELDQQANQLAHLLRRRDGVKPGCLVALCMTRSRYALLGFLGILKAGGAYVPLDPAYPAERIRFMLDDSEATVLVTDDQTRSHLPPHHTVATVCLGSQTTQFEPMPTDSPTSMSSAADLAYVIYTSGSTGRPKGVQIPHRAVVNFLHAMQQRPGITRDDILLAVTTFAFDIAGLELFLPLTVGARVVLASQRTAADGEQLAQRLTTSQATMMQATPITWRLLIEAGWQGRAPFKMLCGGEALTPELAKQLTAGTATLWNLYGPTETTIWSMAAKIDSPQAPVSLGTPIDNTRLYVLDRHRQLVPAGVPGEIYIAGAGLACGYLNRPELTAERFVNVAVNGTTIERLYRTGDLARYRQDGTLAFLGRLDHQVKIRGFRIELEEIESRLQQHSGIDQAVVVAHEIVSGDTRLVAYITSHQHAELAPAALRDYLQITLPDYMIPSAFVRLDALPTTANGKIDRHALPSPHDVTQTVRAPADQQATAPQDTLERQLAQIWAEVLRVRSIGIHDDFFSSGGHSLLAVRLFARIKALCGIHLPLATLFQAPTVAQLAALLRRENWTPPWSSLVTIQPRGAKPPLYCMHAHGGHVLFYKDLAQYLDSEQPVYGLQAYGLDGVHPPHVRVEEMATHYIEEIRTLQPRGPYRLAGFCFGGLIAYEMARQLQAQGEVVSVLALLDANVTGARPRLPNADTLRYTLRRGVERVRHYLGDAWLLQAQDIWPYVSHKMRNATRKFQAPKAEFSLAVKPYTPQPYDGRIALFKASMQGAGFIDEPDLGWRALAAGGVDVQTIPGYRETMLDKPRVRLLARALQQCLDDDLLAEHGM